MSQLAYKIPSEWHTDTDTLHYDGTILANTTNDRLHKSLVKTDKATAVLNYEMTGYAPNLETIAAVVNKAEPIEPVRQDLIDGIKQFTKTLPIPEEMERVRLANANASEKLLTYHQKVGVTMSSTIALGD